MTLFLLIFSTALFFAILGVTLAVIPSDFRRRIAVAFVAAWCMNLASHFPEPQSDLEKRLEANKARYESFLAARMGDIADAKRNP